MTPTSEAGPLLEHLFRHQAGRIISHLTRLFGPSHLDLAEESVQEAMLRALRTWPEQGIPDNPAAWLFRSGQIQEEAEHRILARGSPCIA